MKKPATNPVLALFVLSLLVCCAAVSFSAETQKKAPWWEQGKIRLFWGAWRSWSPLGGSDTSAGDVDPVSDEELMKAVAGVGATVFVDRDRDWTFHENIRDVVPSYSQDWYGITRPAILSRARLARKYGLRYFSELHSVGMPRQMEKTGARLAVNREGLTSKEFAPAVSWFGERKASYVPCPLDESAPNEWLFKYAIDMARSGLVDGCALDWEMSVPGFSGVGDELCYCDDCFGNYVRKRTLKVEVAREDRYGWLREQGLLTDYLLHLQGRLVDVYRRGAKRVRAIKPDFIFAAYDGFMPGHLENAWLVEGWALGLHSRAAPFLVVDAGHYYPNHTAPWWDTGYVRMHRLGMKHILGTYTKGMMGGLPEMDVSATQWIYDAAITHDGWWMWFEDKWGPQDITVFRAAEERLRATEHKVGSFLRRGTQDYTFATLVEQSGDPQRGKNMISRTYHLGDRHLTHINNVNTDHSVSVLVRFPRLKPDTTWTVNNPLTDLYYAHEGRIAVWTTGDLARGVVLTMEKRSEAWLLLTPQTRSVSIDRARTVSAGRIKGHPDRPATGASLPVGKSVIGDFPLVFSRTGPLGYSGHGADAHHLGASIFLVDADGGADSEDRQVFALKGDCWSPRLSPDRTRIAFSAYVNGRGQIYAVNADAVVLTGIPGQEKLGKPYWANDNMASGHSFSFKSAGVNLSKNTSCDHSPVWSPEGGRIAFVSDRDGNWEIYVMNADGSSQRRLTCSPGVDRAPAWSPDGKRIAFESNRNGDFDMCVIGSDGTSERILVNRSGDDLEPCWSPDGARIAFVCNMYTYQRDVLVVDSQTGVPENTKGLVFALRGGWKYSHLQDISWSPDGKYIAGAFELRFQMGSGVFVARTGVTRYLTADKPEGFVAAYNESNDPADHGGGNLVELVTAPPLRSRPGGWNTGHAITGGWYSGGDASNRYVLRTFRDVSWSPDGRRIAFRSDMDPSGYEFFYTIPAAGGSPTRLNNTLNPMGRNNKPAPLN